MPRISWVTPSALLVLLAMLASVPAQARAPLTVLEKLANSREVQDVAADYELVSAGAILYEQCAAEYHVDEAKKAYNDARFAELSKAYMEAFKNAYVARTTKLPPDALIAEYRDYIAQRQQAAKLSMHGSIQTRGCLDTPIMRVDEYLEKKRQYALEQQRSH